VEIIRVFFYYFCSELRQFYFKNKNTVNGTVHLVKEPIIRLNSYIRVSLWVSLSVCSVEKVWIQIYIWFYSWP